MTATSENSPLVLVCGEGLFDLVPSTTAPLSPLVPTMGGGPFNAAIAASRQGAPVQFLSRLSTDTFGQALVSRLESEGVDVSLVQRGPEPTTLALTSIGEDGSARYTFYIEGTADRMVEPPATVAADLACFGTVSLALEPGASRYADLLRTLSKQGTFVTLDPNIRPFYAHDAHKAFLESLYPFVDLLKLSDEEEEFLGSPSAPIKVITRGGDGVSIVLGGTTTIDVPGRQITVADTIGAGDTIMGSLLAQISARVGARGGAVREAVASFSTEDWAEIGAWAVTAAAITCSRTGAQPPTAAEVEAF